MLKVTLVLTIINFVRERIVYYVEIIHFMSKVSYIIFRVVGCYICKYALLCQVAV
jgi:hypothetical protein